MTMHLYRVYGPKHKLIKEVRSSIPPYPVYKKFLTDEYNGVLCEYIGVVPDGD